MSNVTSSLSYVSVTPAEAHCNQDVTSGYISTSDVCGKTGHEDLSSRGDIPHSEEIVVALSSLSSMAEATPPPPSSSSSEHMYAVTGSAQMQNIQTNMTLMPGFSFVSSSDSASQQSVCNFDKNQVPIVSSEYRSDASSQEIPALNSPVIWLTDTHLQSSVSTSAPLPPVSEVQSHNIASIQFNQSRHILENVNSNHVSATSISLTPYLSHSLPSIRVEQQRQSGSSSNLSEVLPISNGSAVTQTSGVSKDCPGSPVSVSATAVTVSNISSSAMPHTDMSVNLTSSNVYSTPPARTETVYTCSPIQNLHEHAAIIVTGVEKHHGNASSEYDHDSLVYLGLRSAFDQMQQPSLSSETSANVVGSPITIQASDFVTAEAKASGSGSLGSNLKQQGDVVFVHHMTQQPQCEVVSLVNSSNSSGQVRSSSSVAVSDSLRNGHKSSVTATPIVTETLQPTATVALQNCSLESSDNAEGRIHDKEFDGLVETLPCYKCKVCPYISLSKEGVEQHVRNQHPKLLFTDNSVNIPCEPQPSPVKSLPVVFDQSSAESIETPRNETNRYYCGMCSKDFPNIESCSMHIMYEHNLPMDGVQIEPFMPADNSGSQVLNDSRQNRRLLQESTKETSSTVSCLAIKKEVSELSDHCGEDELKERKEKRKPVPRSKKKTINLKPEVSLLKRRKINDAVCRTSDSVSDNENGGVPLADGNSELGVPTARKSKRLSSKSRSSIANKIQKPKSESDEGALGQRCDVTGCSVRLKSQENLEYHKRCHIENLDSFVCVECDDKFEYWRTLSLHLWRVHLIDVELFACDLCSYKTYSYGKLMNVHKRIHSDERPYLCDICGKGFKTSKQLRNHKAIHTDQKKHRSCRSGECDVCHRFFADKRMLRVHKDTVHNKIRPFLCNYCGYAASSRSTLKMHIRQHTGEKPFECNLCEYRTADHNSLRRHKMRHSGEKPYKCPYCPYACIQSSTYKTHLKNKHPGMNDGLMYSCEFCTFRTIKKDNFLTHMADHGDNPKKPTEEQPVESGLKTMKKKKKKLKQPQFNKSHVATDTNSNLDYDSDITSEMPTNLHLPLQVVLTAQASQRNIELDEQQLTSLTRNNEIHTLDASVLQHHLDAGVLPHAITTTQFVFSTLEEIKEGIAAQIYVEDTGNQEDKFPILASQLKLAHTGDVTTIPVSQAHVIHSGSQMDSVELAEHVHIVHDTQLVKEHLAHEGALVEVVTVASDDHISQEVLRRAQLTTIAPSEVILMNE